MNIGNKMPFGLAMLILATVFVSLTVVEYVFAEEMNEWSRDIVIELQKPNYRRYLQAIRKIVLLTNEDICILIIVITYNFGTVYKTFILISSSFLGSIVASVLKIILRSRLPYTVYYKVNPRISFAVWPDPPDHAVRMLVFYLVLFHILFESSKYKLNKRLKHIFLFMIFLLSIGLILSKAALGIVFFHSCIYGCLIGVLLYILIIWVLKIDGDDLKQFSWFIELSYTSILGTLLGIFLLECTLIYTRDDEEHREFARAELFSRNMSICIHSYLNDAAMSTAVKHLSFSGYLIGIKLHFDYSFKSNVEDFLNYHFSKVETGDESMLSEMSQELKTRWNHTSFFMSLIRLFVLFCISFLIFVPQSWIDWCKMPFATYLICNCFIPIFVGNLGLSFGYYYVFRVLGLTNVSLANMMQDEIEALSTQLE